MTSVTKGSLLILVQALIWGMFPIIPILTGKTVGLAVSLCISALFATFFLGALLPWRGGLQGLWNWETQRYIFMASLLIGGLYYGLYFYGLQSTSAGNGALFGLMEIPFNALLAYWWWGEKLTRHKLVGIFLVGAGALLILIWNVQTLRVGDFIIILATIFPVYGNWCMQQARKRANTVAILFIRSLWTGLFALIFVFFTGESFVWKPISDSLFFLILNGAIILGLSKILWLEGIRFITVTNALALSVTSVLWTLLFGFFILSQAPTWWQLSAIVPMFFGVRLLTRDR